MTPNEFFKSHRFRMLKQWAHGHCAIVLRSTRRPPRPVTPPGSAASLSPLLEVFGRDEAGPQVAVPDPLGLPPGGVVLGHHLQDVPPLEGKSRLLAGRGLVLQGDVVEQGPHVHLRAEDREGGGTVNKDAQVDVWRHVAQEVTRVGRQPEGR